MHTSVGEDKDRRLVISRADKPEIEEAVDADEAEEEEMHEGSEEADTPTKEVEEGHEEIQGVYRPEF